MKKKIAIISGRDPALKCDLDGGSIITRQLALMFARQNCLVDIYTPLGCQGGSMAHRKLAEQKGRGQFFKRQDIRVVRFPVPDAPRAPCSTGKAEFARRMEMSFAEASYFADGKLFGYDLVAAMHMTHAFGLLCEQRAPADRTVVFPLLLGSHYSKYTDVPEEYLDLERKTLGIARHVQTPSRHEKAGLMGDYGVEEGKIFVVNRGFDPAAFIPVERKACANPPAIICANAVRLVKAQHMFIPAFENLKGAGIEPVMNIIGLNGHGHNANSSAYLNYPEVLRGKILEGGLSQNFIFHPPKFQNRLNSLMAKCDMAAYPSVTETFGKSALESMATGLPTIVFGDVPAFSEFIENRETGLVVERGAGPLADAVRELLADRGLYRKISSQGIQRGKDFHWEKVMGALFSEIRERILG